MRMNVYEWDATPGVSRRLYPLSAHRAEEMVREHGWTYVLLPNGRQAVQKCPPLEVKLERVALTHGNLVAFGRGPLGLWRAPDKLHYEVPHAGDRSIFARHRRRMITVSSRSQIWPSSRPQISVAQASA